MSLVYLFSDKKACDLLANVDGKVVEKYRHFKDFLTHNRDALNGISKGKYVGNTLGVAIPPGDSLQAPLRAG